MFATFIYALVHKYKPFKILIIKQLLYNSVYKTVLLNSVGGLVCYLNWKEAVAWFLIQTDLDLQMS